MSFTPAMSLFFATATLATLGAGLPAQAAPVTLTVTSAVANLCIVGPAQVNSGGATNLGVVSGNTVNIAQLTNDQLTTRATAFDITFDATCNAAHRVTVTSERGGLRRDQTGGNHPGFADGVPYTTRFDWDSSEATLLAPAQSLSEVSQNLDIGAPAAGSLVLHVTIDAGATNLVTNSPLIAGGYSDTLRVVMQVQ
ncbi:MAG TPA: hypothetical protein VHW60_20620 [Caulobacteraceae bacterium]|jgi:hypothetical protein|nr:hypothetical protein [Caulobacteraceae bacterium]